MKSGMPNICMLQYYYSWHPYGRKVLEVMMFFCVCILTTHLRYEYQDADIVDSETHYSYSSHLGGQLLASANSPPISDLLKSNERPAFLLCTTNFSVPVKSIISSRLCANRVLP